MYTTSTSAASTDLNYTFSTTGGAYCTPSVFGFVEYYEKKSVHPNKELSGLRNDTAPLPELSFRKLGMEYRAHRRRNFWGVN